MLRVRYGSFQALESAFVDSLRRRGDWSSAVVAPSRRLADKLERLAVVENGLSLLGAQFHTFHSLALALCEERGLGGLRVVSDPIFHDGLVERLIDEDRGLSRAFGGAGRPKAMCAAARASLRDLIDAGVEFSEVDEAFVEDLVSGSSERGGLTALLALGRAYERRLAELGIASHGALLRAAAEQAGRSALIRGLGAVLFYGFYDLTGLQLDFFEAVSDAAADAELFFAHRPGHPAFRFAQPFFEQKLRGRPHEAVAEVARPSALSEALEALFDPARTAPTDSSRLEIFSVSGARDEAWLVAKEILRLVEGDGARYEDIGVVARSLDPYRGALRDVFSQNAIPFHGELGRPLLSHPLAKTAFNLLNLRRRDFPASLVLDLISSPYFRCPPAQRRSWRRGIARSGIHGGWAQWKGKFACRLDKEPELRPFWEMLSTIRQALGAEGPWSELSGAAWRLLEQRLALPDDSSRDEGQVWSALKQALASFQVFDPLGSARWEDMLEALERKLKEASLDRGSGRGVRVLDAMQARGENFRFLFVLGLKEGLFPRAIQEDPLLRDPVRLALRHPAGFWISPKAAGHDEEKTLFYLLLSSAREKVWAIYPRSDESGKAEVPSLYLRELSRACERPLETAQRVSRQPLQKLASRELAWLSPKELSLRLSVEGAASARYLDLIGQDGGWLEHRLSKIPLLVSWTSPGTHDGLIEPPLEFLEQLSAQGLSAKAIETYGECPFRFFAQRALGLEAEQPPSDRGRLDERAKGRLYHSCLERFYEGLDEDFWDGSPDWEPRLSRAVDSAFSESGWQELGLYPLLWEAARRQAFSVLRRFVSRDLEEIRRSGLRPALFEQALSAPWPGETPSALRGLRLRGVVDRVDRDGNGRFRVIDYKTRSRGGVKLSTAIERGEHSQLPVYVELVASALGEELESARLYFLDDAEAKGKPAFQSYEARDWARARDSFLREIDRRLARISRGRFPISPDEGDFGYCRRCDYAMICRKSHGPSRRRAMLERE
ncbi:MAG: exodeoxyribonuclease V subunit gamma [Elusimicrobia bacterium]|nr:exodeoxyribonuclease V subunit gamma [Elusimicrobiota bacterium]